MDVDSVATLTPAKLGMGINGRLTRLPEALGLYPRIVPKGFQVRVFDLATRFGDVVYNVVVVFVVFAFQEKIFGGINLGQSKWEGHAMLSDLLY